MTGTNLNAFTPHLRDIVREEVDGKSIISPENPEGGLGKYAFESSTPAKEPGAVTIGTGKARAGYVFSPQPDAFNPVVIISRAQGVGGESAAPERPRRASCDVVYLTGALGENTQTTLRWAPPVTDTTGRWLENISSDLQSTTYTDSIMYYMLRRTCMETGEVVTLGMVPHSKQAVTLIRQFLESEKSQGRLGATTEINNHLAEIDAGLYQPLLDLNGDPILDSGGHPITELVIPEGNDVFFSFTDTTTQLGSHYHYMITAITAEQQEGSALTVIPGAPAAAGGLELVFPPAWSASYPNYGAGGQEAYVDLTLTVGNLITDVDVAVIPVMDSAMVVDTSDLPATDPYVSETMEAEVIVYKKPPAESGTLTNTAHFIARNWETNGGVSNTLVPAGVTIVSLTKGDQVSGTQDDWEYTLVMTVAPTVQLGPQTLTFQFPNGKSCTWSHVTVKELPDPIYGAIFTGNGNVYRKTSTQPRTLVLTGTRMDTIQNFTLTPANLTTFTITAQSTNSLTISYTAFVGTVKFHGNLKPGYTETGKTNGSLVVTQTIIKKVTSVFGGADDRSTTQVTVTREHGGKANRD